MLETVFLAVLVLALLLGNAFLSIISPKRAVPVARLVPEGSNPGQGALAGQTVLRPVFSGQGASEQAVEQSPVSRQNLPLAGQEPSFEDSVKNERIEYLGRRIARLEQLLLKLNGSKPIAAKIKVSRLSQKLDDLDDFRQNTKLEIEALKQRLDSLQPVQSKAKDSFPEISDEKLREIVFRASH